MFFLKFFNCFFGWVLKPCSCSKRESIQQPEEWFFMSLLAGLCFIFGLLGFVISLSKNHPFFTNALYSLAYLTGGWRASTQAWSRLKKRELDVDFLMLAVALGAATIGAWREGALLLFLFSASSAMEHFAMGRTQKAISALFHQAPKTARLLRDGKEFQVPVDDLTPGMIVRVTSGEQIPVDLTILKGKSACDESNLTGEATPVRKHPGDHALSGTINLWGVLEGEVVRPASESSLQKIIRLIGEAQKLKAPSQRFTDRFGTHYTLLVLTACTVMFFLWWLLLDQPPSFSTSRVSSAFYRSMTLLVVASPCALVLSVPSAILSAIASGARRGILYRGGAAIETLAQVHLVAFDKTGTITSGNLQFSSLQSFQGEEKEIEQIAYSLAHFSEHPLSRAIERRAALWQAPLLEVQKLETIPGFGLQGVINQETYVLGSFRFIEQFRERFHLQLPSPDAQAAEHAVVWIAGKHLLGCLNFRDEIREEATATLKQLHAEGVRTVMLTGDRQDAAQITGKRVNIGTILAELSPAQKVHALEKLKEGGRYRVAMIGDGVNDAPSLAAADVGVAMGIRGSDAALEQAEIVLMNDRLENFLLARKLSYQARSIIYQNIAIALGTVLLMIVSTLLAPIPLTLGVAAHEGSTLLVVLNSLRLLRAKL